MKIILIGPGNKNIPPKGWGACESIVWDYYLNLQKRSIDVEFISEPSADKIIQICNEKNPDIVHIMYDNYYSVAPQLKCSRIFLTTHFAYITHPQFATFVKSAPYFRSIFSPTIAMQRNYKLIALSDEVADVYKRHGFDEARILVLRNGAREDIFKYNDTPSKADKSVYVAKIEARKCQYKYQSIDSIDFVGNYHPNSSFEKSNPNYLGEWTKPVLYNSLTEYGNLILLSNGEADPLVVKEALMSGLGVVVSECSKSNLDLSKDFITVIPNSKLDDLDYVRQQINKNREICKLKRAEIREYALSVFSWDVIVTEYLQLISK